MDWIWKVSMYHLTLGESIRCLISDNGLYISDLEHIQVHIKD